MAEVAEAYVSLIPTARGFGRRVEGQIGGDTEKAGKRTGARFGKVFASASISPLRAFGAAAVGLFAIDKVKDFFGSAISEARESQKVGAITAQVIKTTGGAAQVSAKQVGDLATAISNKTGVDDEAIQSASNLLLTFTNLRNEVGKGNDVFNQATRIATDMGAALGTEPKAAAIQLGKALNDPVKGITALSRVGVSFTAQQKQQIKTLTASGNTLGAQKIILKELNKEFGGTAAASATAGEKLSVAFGNFKEQIGTALLPIIDRLAGFLTTKVIPAVSAFVDGIQNSTGAGGQFRAFLTGIYNVLKPVATFLIETVVPAVRGFFTSLTSGGSGAPSVFTRIGAAMAPVVAFIRGQLIPAVMGVVAGFQAFAARAIPIVLQIVGVIRANFPAIAAIIRQVMSTVSTIIIAVFTVVKTIFKVATVVITRLWSVFGASILGTIKRVLPAILTIVKGVLNVIQGVVRVFTNLLKGNWSGAWAAVKQVVKGAWQIIGGVVRAGIGLIRGVISGGLAAIKAGFSGVWGALKSIVSAAWSAITGAVKSGVGRVISEVKNLGSRLLSAFRGFNTLLLGVGQDIVQGLVNGIRGAAGRVLDAARHLVDQIPGPIRKLMGIASPSKVMIQIGKYVTAGLIKGLEADADRVKTTSARLADYVTKAFRGKLISAKGRKSITDLIDKDTKRLAQLAKDRVKAGDKLKAAQDKLAAATSARDDYKAQIRSSIIGEGSIIGKAGDNPLTSTSLIAGLQAQVKSTQAFARNLGQLQKLGLNKTTYQQLLEAGVDQGGDTVAALLKGGKGAVNQVNSLTKQLKTSAEKIGANGAKTFFQAGVDSARGLVKGLAASAGDLADSAATLAKALVKAVKKALKIKSPSRVFANEVGKQIPAGISMGLDAGQKALDKRVGRLVSVPGLRTPAFAGGPATSAAAGAGVTVQGDVYGATPKQIVDELAAKARLQESLHPVFAA